MASSPEWTEPLGGAAPLVPEICGLDTVILSPTPAHSVGDMEAGQS